MYETELCKIMNRNRSDKGSGQHNYTIEYERLFYKIKDNVKNVFEVGVGTNYIDVQSSMGPDARPGASLYGWKEYFPDANIFGADIDTRILFEDEKIKTFFVDQTNSDTIKQMWENEHLKDVSFDIMIDDGLHHPQANVNFFKNSYHKLKMGGVYTIEDVRISKLSEYTSMLDHLKNDINFRYDIKILGNVHNPYDNCLIVIYLV